MMTFAAWLAFVFAAVPLALIVLNLPRFRPPKRAHRKLRPHEVSVLIPARNEAERIQPAIESVLESASDAEIELLIYDDDSHDSTPAIVAACHARDARVRLLRGRSDGPTHGGGKPIACAQLAEQARGSVLVFMDADVRLEGDALERIVAALDGSHAALLSGVPRQVTVSLAERLIVPLVQFVLLGFLPLIAMRRFRSVAFGAACGQLLAVHRDAYLACGGHRAVAHRVHDAIALARRFREAGYMTDLADFTTLARCRLYHNAREVIDGFAKNAHEGLGAPASIVPWTAVLLGGQVAWVIALPAAVIAADADLLLPALLTAACALTARGLLVRRFESSATGVLLHPIGVAALTGVQWYAWLRRRLGRPIPWKGRPVQPSRREDRNPDSPVAG